MALTYTITEKFPTKANGVPKYYTNDFIKTNLKGISFFNTGCTIGITSTAYSYFTFDFTFTGTAKYIGVSFSADSTISVGLDSLDNLFMPFADGKLDDWDIKLTAGVTQRVYVIVNGDQNKVTTYLNIMCSTGNKTGIPAIYTNSIIIDYDCTVSLYAYTAGLHVYSAYDSIYSPILTTKLYSKQIITNWLPGTRVWADAEFSTPAYPYFYGIDNYVYKVGDTLDRSYGTTEKYETVQTAWRQLWGKEPIINKVVTTDHFTNVSNDTTSACVNVIMLRSGTIIRKELKTSYVQPSKYKYLMGYSSSSKQDSNDLFFTKYIYAQNEWYPITGYHHSTYKLAGGYTKSLAYLGFDIPEESFAPVLLAGGTALALAVSGIVTIGGLMATAASSCPIVATAAAAALGSNPVGWIITLAIVAIIAIVGIIYTLFNKHRETYEELCKQFLHEYTTTPYILIGNPLSRTKNMSSPNSGYFCDGVYFYTQSGGVVTVKELSSTNALISEDPIKSEFRYSLQADDPTLVTRLDKLMLLPYTSGIPVEWPVPVYKSAAMSDTPTYTCIGDLMVLPVVLPSISLPLGFITSAISQADADFRALEYLQQAKLVASTYNYCTLLPGEELGLLESYFTHEIKVEQYPTTASCFYDNRNGLGLTIGKRLYYDAQGRILAMNGFYAIDGPNPAFRTFYHTTNGIVDGIYTMATSNSTIVTGTDTLSVITVNLEYTSNWYLTSINVWDLSRKINTTITPRTFNPNTLYSDTMLVRGYINQSHCMFYLYTDNYSSTSMNEAESGWYYGMIEWGHSFSWYYQKSQVIRLDIQEVCLPSGTYNNALFGFYVIGMENGYQTAVFNNVTLTVNVYKNNMVLAATYNVVTDIYADKTYFPYDNQILPTDNITSIQITSIGSVAQDCPNKITYTAGIFTNCDAPTTTTTTLPLTTTTTTTIVCSASLGYTYTNPTTGNNGTATITISNGVPSYIYSCPQLGQTSPVTTNTSFIITGLAYSTPYTVTVYYNVGFFCSVQTIITLTAPPTTTTTTTYICTPSVHNNGQLVVNGSAYSTSIDTICQVDWYWFTTGALGTYTIETHGLSDMYMCLYGPNNQTSQIECNDDGGVGTNSKIVRSNLDASTLYNLELYYYLKSGTGAYSVDVKYVANATTTTTTQPPTTTTTTTKIYYTVVYSCVNSASYVTSSHVAYDWFYGGSRTTSSRAIDTLGNYYTVQYANNTSNPWTWPFIAGITPVIGQVGCPTTTTTTTTRPPTTTTTTLAPTTTTTTLAPTTTTTTSLVISYTLSRIPSTGVIPRDKATVVTIKLVTTGVALGTNVAFTTTGILTSDIFTMKVNGSTVTPTLTGNFVVSNQVSYTGSFIELTFSGDVSTLTKTLSLYLNSYPSQLVNIIIGVGVGSGYGKLYNWYATTGLTTTSIASTGWRVPTNADWSNLYTYLGGTMSGSGGIYTWTVVGDKLKESGNVHWNTPNAGTNSSLFNGRGSGGRSYGATYQYGSFYGIKNNKYIWELNTTTPMIQELSYNTSTARNYQTFKNEGLSVRLVRESGTVGNGVTGSYTGNDGTVYTTIGIGAKEWLAEDLRETKYRNGVNINNITDNTQWHSATTGAYCSYNNDTSYD